MPPPRSSSYLEGWLQGVRWTRLQAGYPRMAMRMAHFLVTFGVSDYAAGWADAMLSGFGA